MIDYVLLYLQTHILPLGAWGVFVASIIEEIITPIPSALIMMAAGFIFLKGPFTLALLSKLIFVVVIPATIGVTIGSFVIYGVGYWGGKSFLDRWGKWFGLSWNDVQNFQHKSIVKRTETLALFITRATPFIPSTAVAFFCGFIRQPLKIYLLITLTGVFIRSTILALLGWYLGSLYTSYADIGSSIERILLLLLAAAGIAFLIYRRWRSKKNILKPESPRDTIDLQ